MMISPEDLTKPYQDPQASQASNTAIDVQADVIPIYSSKRSDDAPPNKAKLVYDIAMLITLLVDLAVIFFDQVVMSAFFAKLSDWLGLVAWLGQYKANTHYILGAIGGFFTIFLITELMVRWAIAINKKTYYRWFFFPFVHWYEVLGCFPLLRPLRLLRALIIIKRLHDMGVKVVPNRWIKSAKFYGHILLEELSDRVILTALGNFRSQLNTPEAHSRLIEKTISKNKVAIEQVILLLLRKELTPKLLGMVSSDVQQILSKEIGQAVEKALIETPELRRYLKMIPIAGSMIEAQVVDIGRHIGENVTTAVHETLLSPMMLDKLMGEIAKGVANIDTSHEQLQDLIASIVHDGVDAFEAQVKIQQWKHTEHLHL